MFIFYESAYLCLSRGICERVNEQLNEVKIKSYFDRGQNIFYLIRALIIRDENISFYFCCLSVIFHCFCFFCFLYTWPWKKFIIFFTGILLWVVRFLNALYLQLTLMKYSPGAYCFSFILKWHNLFQFIAELITCKGPFYLNVCNKARGITPEIEIAFEV